MPVIHPEEAMMAEIHAMEQQLLKEQGDDHTPAAELAYTKMYWQYLDCILQRYGFRSCIIYKEDGSWICDIVSSLGNRVFPVITSQSRLTEDSK